MNTCENPNYIYYISFIIGIIINIFIINTLNTIEKRVDCACANNPKKAFLKEWFIFILFYNILFIFFFMISNYNCYDVFAKEYMNIFIKIPLLIISIIMLVRLFIYIRWLKNECKCSYQSQEQIIYWYLIILFIIFFGIIFFFIIALLILSISIKKLKY